VTFPLNTKHTHLHSHTKPEISWGSNKRPPTHETKKRKERIEEREMEREGKRKRKGRKKGGSLGPSLAECHGCFWHNGFSLSSTDIGKKDQN